MLRTECKIGHSSQLIHKIILLPLHMGNVTKFCEEWGVGILHHKMGAG
jgi:hypothetical protein